MASFLIQAGAFAALLLGGSFQGNQDSMLYADQLGKNINLGLDPMYGFW